MRIFILDKSDSKIRNEFKNENNEFYLTDIHPYSNGLLIKAQFFPFDSETDLSEFMKKVCLDLFQPNKELPSKPERYFRQEKWRREVTKIIKKSYQKKYQQFFSRNRATSDLKILFDLALESHTIDDEITEHLPELAKELEKDEAYVYKYYQFKKYKVSELTFTDEKLYFSVFFPKQDNVKTYDSKVIFTIKKPNFYTDLNEAKKWFKKDFPRLLESIRWEEEHRLYLEEIKKKYGKEAKKLIKKNSIHELVNIKKIIIHQMNPTEEQKDFLKTVDHAIDCFNEYSTLLNKPSDYRSKFKRFWEQYKEDIIDYGEHNSSQFLENYENDPEAFIEEIEELYNKTDENLDDAIYNKKVYRATSVNSIETFLQNIREGKRSVGICWAYHRNYAEAHWGGGLTVILVAEISKEDIDIDYTYFSGIINTDEGEITLHEGVSVKLLKILGENDKNLLNEPIIVKTEIITSKNKPSDSKCEIAELNRLSEIIKESNIDGFGGNCGIFAVGLRNEVLPQGIIVGVKSKYSLDSSGLPHVMLKWCNYYWDSSGMHTEQYLKEFAFDDIDFDLSISGDDKDYSDSELLPFATILNLSDKEVIGGTGENPQDLKSLSQRIRKKIKLRWNNQGLKL